MSGITVKNTFTDRLSADPDTSNRPRQVHACYSWVSPKGMKQPQMVIYSQELAEVLGIPENYCQSQEFTDIMTGNKLPENSKSFAMCYGGHQFGNWADQLGDGRAINLGDIETHEGHLNLQLKGAGPTPFSRFADGLAVLRSSVREFLCSEAMYYLGVPTTRALSLTLTGEEVLRDVMYNGNAAYEKGAVVCRVAPTFIRFGNFEILASRQDEKNLKALADFTIEKYYFHLLDSENKYLEFFRSVSEATCNMIVDWQRVGFVHGVMNTDNMCILGQTIDYGPYGWLDNYDPDWTPNTTDLPGKRYRFGNQPVIAQWNMLKLANALYPLINDEESLKQIIQDFRLFYAQSYMIMMKSKTGLFENRDSDESLIYDLEQMLQVTEIDMTIFFRVLSRINHHSNDNEIFEIIKPAFYIEGITDEARDKILRWFNKYRARLKEEIISEAERSYRMNAVNPKYVLRNYMAQLAIDDADKGDYGLLHELFDMLKHPYDDQPQYGKWFEKRPDWAREKVGCSMLSCSS
ncbi:MAG: YdiU family protein [Saprospiraceae bacterium]|nr:YdiU family protein [Saprospiraceae bacterium]